MRVKPWRLSFTISNTYICKGKQEHDLIDRVTKNMIYDEVSP